jgi:hypothetical protein
MPKGGTVVNTLQVNILRWTETFVTGGWCHLTGTLCAGQLDGFNMISITASNPQRDSEKPQSCRLGAVAMHKRAPLRRSSHRCFTSRLGQEVGYLARLCVTCKPRLLKHRHSVGDDLEAPAA